MPQTLTNQYSGSKHLTPRESIRWTLENCKLAESVGALPEKYELINGEIYEKMPTNPPHESTLMFMMIWLLEIFGIDRVRPQQTLSLSSNRSRPEPDLAVLKTSIREFIKSYPSPSDMLLVVEVSDTSLHFDLSTKALLYSAAGVPEYWVVNVADREIVVHRDPSHEGYLDVKLYDANEQISALAKPEASILVGELVPDSR